MKETLTIKEVREMYGNLPLRFSSYYKFSFTFVGVAEDCVEVVASYGGNSDDIYKFDVRADKDYTINELEPSWITTELRRVDGTREMVCQWSNF